jgi:putative ABC transport system ATP-binding protein
LSSRLAPRPQPLGDPASDGTPALRGAGLEKRFGDTVALAGVDLDLRRGESVAVMGPSGSGKSTLLHGLAGITPPDGGTVWLDGRRIDNLGERSRSRLRRGEFGFVFQSGLLLPELPAAENVALPLMLDGQRRRRAVRRARAWLARLGLDGLEHRRPGELSGGQAQRVAIARAVVAEPAVVFADEPTVAPDQATGVATVGLLVQVTREADTALLVVTHAPNIAALCDRTVHLRDGHILPPHPPTPPPSPPCRPPQPTTIPPPRPGTAPRWTCRPPVGRPAAVGPATHRPRPPQPTTPDPLCPTPTDKHQPPTTTVRPPLPCAACRSCRAPATRRYATGEAADEQPRVAATTVAEPVVWVWRFVRVSGRARTA